MEERKEMKGIIFDLDGVIVFTDKYHYQAWKQMADRMGIYFDEKINDRLRGVSRLESLEIILEKYEGPKLTEEEKIACATEKNEIYKELLKKMGPGDVTDEVRETLKELRARGYKIALGSSSKNAKFILKQVDLASAFDAISDGENIINSKPNPEVFVKAAEFLNLPVRECAVVEDAEAGIQAAISGGMKPIAIGAVREAALTEWELETFGDLLKIFK